MTVFGLMVLFDPLFGPLFGPLFDPPCAPLGAGARMLREVAAIARLAAQTARLMVGIPDYSAYLEHRRRFHAGEAMMSYEAFFRDRQQARYARGRYGGFC